MVQAQLGEFTDSHFLMSTSLFVWFLSNNNHDKKTLIHDIYCQACLKEQAESQSLHSGFCNIWLINFP